MSDSQMMVQVEYLGSSEKTFSIRSQSPFHAAKNIFYRFSNNPNHKISTVLLDDAERLIKQVDEHGNPIFRLVTNRTSEIYVPDPNHFYREIFIGAVGNKVDSSRAKCQYCGQYGVRQSICKSCGAAID